MTYWPTQSSSVTTLRSYLICPMIDISIKHNKTIMQGVRENLVDSTHRRLVLYSWTRLNPRTLRFKHTLQSIWFCWNLHIDAILHILFTPKPPKTSYLFLRKMMWGFPGIRGPPSHQPFLDGLFPNKNHPAIGGTTMTMETPIFAEMMHNWW